MHTASSWAMRVHGMWVMDNYLTTLPDKLCAWDKCVRHCVLCALSVAHTGIAFSCKPKLSHLELKTNLLQSIDKSPNSSLSISCRMVATRIMVKKSLWWWQEEVFPSCFRITTTFELLFWSLSNLILRVNLDVDKSCCCCIFSLQLTTSFLRSKLESWRPWRKPGLSTTSCGNLGDWYHLTDNDYKRYSVINSKTSSYVQKIGTRLVTSKNNRSA